MKHPWMPLYIPDYLADTAHLTTAEHGAYLLLLMAYWLKGGLPKDEEVIRRITKMNGRQWAHSRDIVMSYFGDDLRNKRADQELAKVIEKSKINSANAQRSHVIRKANASVSHMPLNTNKEKKDGADAPLPEKATAEKELFDRGKEILGQNAGGLVRKVLKAKGDNVALARAAIEQASTKQNPLEYAGRIAAGPPDNTPPDIRERTKASGFYARLDSPEQRAWEQYRGSAPRDRDGGWLYPNQWPPDEKNH